MKNSLLLTFGAVLVASACRSTPFEDRQRFTSPELAVTRMVEDLRVDDVEHLSRLLGTAADDVLDSGDRPADREGRRRFLELYDEAHRIERPSDDVAVLHIGAEDWPFPIPIVRVDQWWYLDTEEGVEEINDRRIGRNELSMMQVALALVDAQREYAATDWNGDGIREYARTVRSSQGKKDGLYWPVQPGEAVSPIGELAAAAARQGYDVDQPREDEPSEPFHGYFWRLLTGQGGHAPGGAYSYLAGDHMIGGFAAVAYPSDYGHTGVMTFLVNHDGIIFQKDLGERSEKLAKAMALFDPDESWSAVPSEELEQPPE